MRWSAGDWIPARLRVAAVAACAATLTAAVGSAQSTPTTDVIAVEGEASPDGDGAFGNFRFARPVLNDDGQLAFDPSMTGSDSGSGLFRGDADFVEVIARLGDVPPEGNGAFIAFARAAINDAGEVHFFAAVDAGGAVEGGLYSGDGLSLTRVAREGQAAPGGGTFDRLFHPASFNLAGHVAFDAELTGTTGGAADDTGVFRGDGTTLVEIAREGDVAPDGDGTIFFPGAPRGLNASGQVLFSAVLTGNAGGSAEAGRLYRGDETGLVEVARAGQEAPDGNGAFNGFAGTALDDADRSIFAASLSGTTGGTADDSGIFRAEAAGTLVTLAREGQDAPDDNGQLGSMSSFAANNDGQAAFRSFIAGESGGGGTGIFLADGLTLRQIAREDAAAPDDAGFFRRFEDPALNDAGQLAFLALTGPQFGNANASRLYFFDDALGLVEVAATGDEFLGSSITWLGFIPDINRIEAEGRGGLNDRGQVGFAFELADGRSGAAIWSVPEPSATALLAAGGLALLRRCRR